MSQTVSKIEAELSELRQAHSLARAQGEFSEAHHLAQQILDAERGAPSAAPKGCVTNGAERLLNAE